jgi:tetratricopeptide (TPR) repeat protein
MKRLVLGLMMVVLLMIAGNANAGSWSIHCINDSCEASQGKLKVYWSGMGSLNLTGVEGLPVSIEDFQTAEKKIEQAMEKSISDRKGSDINVTADGREKDDLSVKMGEKKENLFSKKKSIRKSMSKGQKVNIDYTLAFVKWLGDTRYYRSGYSYPIGRYWAAAERALQAYMDGTIGDMIELFFISRNAEEIKNVDVSSPISDDNKMIVMAKYVGLTRFPGVQDASERYSLASNMVYDITAHDLPVGAEITANYKKDMQAIKELLKPNQTAIKLYAKDKDLAFGKWLADNNKLADHINQMPISDKYIVVARIADELKTGKINADDLKDLRAEFEKAIQSKDQSVKIVTVKGASIPVVPIVVVVGMVLLVGVIVFTKKKKKSINHVGIISISALLVLTLSGNVFAQQSPVDYQSMLEKCAGITGDALSWCDNAIKVNPKGAKAYYYRGLTFSFNERYAKAIQDFSKAIELGLTGDDLVSAYYSRGYAYEKSVEYEKAISDYKTVEKEHSYAKERLADLNNKGIYKKIEDAKQKEIDLKKELEKNQNDYSVYNSLSNIFSDVDRSKTLFYANKMIETGKTPQEKANGYYYRGWVLHYWGETKDALNDYNKSIQLYPDNEMVYYHRGYLYNDDKDVDKQIADFKKALEIAPDFKDALWGLGNAFIRKIEITEGSLLWFRNRGEKAPAKRKEYLMQAINAFEQLATLDPEYDARVYWFLGNWYLSLPQPDCIKGLKYREKVADRFAPDILAEDYIFCKEYNKGIDIYKKEIAKYLSSNDLTAYTEYVQKLAKAYFQKIGIPEFQLMKPGEFSKSALDLRDAIKYLNNALVKLPDCPQNWAEMDVKIASHCSDKAKILGLLGMAYHALGDTPKAYKFYSDCIDIYPNSEALTRRSNISYSKRDYKSALDDCLKSKESHFTFFANADFLRCSDDYIAHLQELVNNSKNDNNRHSQKKASQPKKQKEDYKKVW